MDKPTRQVKPQKNPLRLTSARERNHTSQCGEDGIVAAIFEHLEVDAGVAVEFGAWDGVRYSNTNALVERGWKVIFIEGDTTRFQTLVKNFQRSPKVHAIHAWVTPTGETSLDALLVATGTDDVDFLSVDIDGNDYHVLASLKMQPKVVCVEFNPTIPPPIHFVGGLGRSEGSSLVALDTCMHQKGFALVYATKWNAFFVRGDLAARFAATTPAESFDYRSARFVISFFDGRNQIVDVKGERARARNQWSKATAAISLKLPPRRQIIVGLAIVFVVGAAIWIL